MSLLLQVNKVSRSYNQQVVLDQASFTVGSKQKIAVIGRNGTGKTTLFKIITGQEKADDGEIIFGQDLLIGYLKQESDFREEDTVLSYLMRESDKEEWECSKIVSQFELKNEKLNEQIKSLSGGYQMRVKLSLMLLKNPNLILLDEPTNYLDLSTMLLLEKFLINYRGAYLIISHDRKFIGNTCNEIIELERGKAHYFPNTLEHYFAHKKEKLEGAEKFNKKQERRKQHLQKFIDRFGAKATKAKQAKSKEKQIEKIEKISIGQPLSMVRMRIKDAKTDNGFAWRLDKLAIGYGEKVIADDICIDIERASRFAVLGDNGQGKSTFLRTLAEEIPIIAGKYKKLANLKVAYYAQHVAENLNNKETVKQHLERSADFNYTDEDIFKMAGNFLFHDDDLEKPIYILSGGEKARLCLAGILLNQNDVLLLDEPTNHLDFETVEVLARSLARTNVTILFISHDRTFINLLATRILEVKNGKVKYFSGYFSDYVEHLTKKELITETDNNTNNFDLAKEQKRLIYEKEKEIKRELDKIEKMLDNICHEQDVLLIKFENNPINPKIEWGKRLKELDEKKQELEEQWLEISKKIV